MIRRFILLCGVLVLLAALAAGAYAGWYVHDRNAKIAHNEACNNTLSKPAETSVGVLPSCVFEIVPPTLWQKLTGAQSSVLPAPSVLVNGCDQSATTTDCAKLASPQTPPKPYIPPNPVQPTKEWTSATDTPISFAGFSFVLPSGWHGAVYEKPYAGGFKAYVQKSLQPSGFSIDCPPDGKGLEAATRLSSEERSFTIGTTTYSVAFEQWTESGNAPWYFVWLREKLSGDWDNVVCLTQGDVNPDIAQALQSLYETWK